MAKKQSDIMEGLSSKDKLDKLYWLLRGHRLNVRELDPDRDGVVVFEIEVLPDNYTVPEPKRRKYSRGPYNKGPYAIDEVMKWHEDHLNGLTLNAVREKYRLIRSEPRRSFEKHNLEFEKINRRRK